MSQQTVSETEERLVRFLRAWANKNEAEASLTEKAFDRALLTARVRSFRDAADAVEGRYYHPLGDELAKFDEREDP